MPRVFDGSRALMAAAARAVAKPAAATAAKADKPKNTVFMKPHPVSPALKKFVGAPEISRPEAVKMIWDHIKANQLQNPANKREIRCDERLKSIFDGKDTVNMLEIARLLSAHFPKSS